MRGRRRIRATCAWRAHRARSSRLTEGSASPHASGAHRERTRHARGSLPTLPASVVRPGPTNRCPAARRATHVPRARAVRTRRRTRRAAARCVRRGGTGMLQGRRLRREGVPHVTLARRPRSPVPCRSRPASSVLLAPTRLWRGAHGARVARLARTAMHLGPRTLMCVCCAPRGRGPL